MEKKSQIKSILLLLGVIFLTILAYSSVFHAEYIWDDLALFVHSTALRQPSDVVLSITQPILPGSTYFRPLVLLSFVLEFELFDANSSVSHTVNLVLLVINGILLLILAKKSLVLSRAVIVASLYLLHPALIESTAWVSGRFDLLLTTFTILAFISVTYFSGYKKIIFTVFFFFCAALCKEMAVTIPLLLPIIIWITKYETLSTKRYLFEIILKKDLLLYLSLFFAGLIYLSLRMHFMTSILKIDTNVDGSLSILEHLGFIGETLWFYLKKALWPFSSLNPMHPADFNNINIVLGIVILLSSLTFISFAILRPTVRRLLFLAFLISLLPVLNILPLTIGDNIGHERFLAMPVIFIALLIGTLKIPKEKLSNSMHVTVTRTWPILLTAWLALCFLNVQATAKLWKNHHVFWSWAYSKNSHSAFVSISYIASSIRAGEYDKAENAIYQARSLNNDEFKETFVKQRLLALEAMLEMNRENFSKAIVVMNSLIDSMPNMPHKLISDEQIDSMTLKNKTFEDVYAYRSMFGILAESYIGIKEYEKSLESIRIMKFYDRDYPPIYLLEAMAYIGKGEIDIGNKLFFYSLNLYDNSGRESGVIAYLRYLSKLCQNSGNEDVCKYFDETVEYAKTKNLITQSY